MADMAFHSRDVNFRFPACLLRQPFELFPDMRNKKYPAMVFGTEHKMIVYEGHRSLCPEVFVISIS